MGSTPGQGTKILPAVGQLSPQAARRESQHTAVKTQHSLKQNKTNQQGLCSSRLFNPGSCNWSISTVEMSYTGKKRALSNQNSNYTRSAEPHLELSSGELRPPGHHVYYTLREEHQDICVAFKENPGKRTKGSHGSHVLQTSLPCPASIEVITFMLNAAGEACFS